MKFKLVNNPNQQCPLSLCRGYLTEESWVTPTAVDFDSTSQLPSLYITYTCNNCGAVFEAEDEN